MTHLLHGLAQLSEAFQVYFGILVCEAFCAAVIVGVLYLLWLLARALTGDDK